MASLSQPRSYPDPPATVIRAADLAALADRLESGDYPTATAMIADILLASRIMRRAVFWIGKSSVSI